MKTNFTKSKWMTDRPTFTEITVCTEQIDVCTVLCIDINEEEAEANARLISSAPELLRTCDSILTNLKRNRDLNEYNISILEIDTAINILTRVINQATE